MRRGAKPGKAKVEAKPPIARKARKSKTSRVNDLEKHLAEALKREAEALEQQTATSEILRVISSSATELGPVLDTVAANAARVCDAEDIGVFQLDGDTFRAGGRYGTGPKQDIGSIARIRRDLLLGRTFLERRTIHVHDMAAELESEYPGMRSTVERFGMRTMLCTPLLSGGKAVGVIVAVRYEVRPFADKHIRLLETFADQAVIAIENVRLFTELGARNRDLAEALEQQTATSDILKVISQSQTDVQPVFEAIAESALRLCDAKHGMVFLFDGELIHLTAVTGTEQEATEAARRSFPQAPGRASATTRAIQTLRAVVIPDVLEDPEFELTEIVRVTDFRSVMSVPMLRGGKPIGAVTVTRAAAAPFPDTQVALLQTFADQAVIAIENVRLFKELQTSNRDLTTALEQQTATAEILRVISTSPTDLQPVLDALAKSAVHFCGAYDATLFQVDGETYRVVAHHGPIPFPLGGRFQLVRGYVTGRSILDRQSVHVPDLQAQASEFPEGSALAIENDQRTTLAVPLLREGEAIGTIQLRRTEASPFTDKQIELLKTFADQAVIAIENVRLFKELEDKNRALTQAHGQVSEALEQQTATSEVLKVISRSTFDLQPVLDTLVENATRLCGANTGLIWRFDGEVFRLKANYGLSAEAKEFWERNPHHPGRGSLTRRAALERRPIHIPDVLADREYQSAEGRRVGRYRTLLGVPMLREGALIGVFSLERTEAQPFTDKQIELVATFADQAVIGIENVRLLTELQSRTRELARSVEELQALGEVSRAVSSTLDLGSVLDTIVSRAVQLSGSDQGIVYEFDEGSEIFHARATHRVTPEHLDTVSAAPIRLGEGAIGRAGEIRAPVQVADIQDESQPVAAQVRELLVHEGMRSLLAIPLMREQRLLGGLVILRREQGAFSTELVSILQTFATQSVLAIQNARLFREIEDKSRQLEAASQHKSEFLANMSHELRTPLNAIIGFSEVLTDRMFGELNEKQEEYLTDIYASGTHLLSLINDILDLSKIEAGRMELELTDFHLPTALDNALTLVRERAGRRSIALHTSIDNRLGQIQGDERKIRQIVLNLLSNAIKFTPEGGRVELAAAPRDGSVEVSVSDTGVGIAPEDQETVFEEFRQVGTAAKKVEGTGLGLTLCRKFVELHGGRIWVKSQLGVGSTFTFTIPGAPWRMS